MAKTNSLKILVVDDHESVLGGTIAAVQKAYPEASISTATTAIGVLKNLNEWTPDVLILDLAIPETLEDTSQVQTGIQLLRSLLERYPELNIVVQSAHVRTLVRLKPAIDTHQGGFTIADKGLSMKEMLVKVP